MKLVVVLFNPLVFNILPDYILTAFFADGIDIVAIRPKLATPQGLLDGWHLMKYLPSGDAFYSTHDFCRAVGRNGLNEKMDMIFIRTDL